LRGSRLRPLAAGRGDVRAFSPGGHQFGSPPARKHRGRSAGLRAAVPPLARSL